MNTVKRMVRAESRHEVEMWGTSYEDDHVMSNARLEYQLYFVI